MAKRQKRSMLINSIPDPEKDKTDALEKTENLNVVEETSVIENHNEDIETSIEKDNIESTEFENVTSESDVIIDLQNKLAESEIRYLDLMSERDNLQDRVINLNEELNLIKNDCEIKNNEIQNLTSECNSLHEKVSDLTERLNSIKNNHEIEESRFQFEILNLKSQLEESKKAKPVKTKTIISPPVIPQSYYNTPPRKMSQLEKEGYESWN